MTFEEASRDILAESRLSRIATEDIPATPWNWRQELENDRIKASNLIDKLCSDLSIITERPIIRNSIFKSENYMISPNQTEQAQWSWKKFLHWYPIYLKQAIDNLKAQTEGDKVFTYPISHIRWDKGSATIELPNDMDEVTLIKLTEPITVPCDKVNLPKHVQRKLELLEQTEYDYQPYILQSKEGEKVLAIRLGCQWRDIAITTFKKPQIKNINNVLIFLIVTLFTLFGVGLYGQSMIEGVVLRTIIAIASLALGLLGVLFLSLFMVKRYRPLKV